MNREERKKRRKNKNKNKIFFLLLVHSIPKPQMDLADQDEATRLGGLLFFAAKNNRFEEVRRLLQEPRIRVNDAVGGDYMTSLHVACVHGALESVKLLTGDDRVDVNAVDSVGQTPLLLAVFGGFREIAREMLACPRLEVNRGVPSPFWLAISLKHTSIIRLLLAMRPDVDVSGGSPQGIWTFSSLSPLQLAQRKGFHEIASLVSSFQEDPEGTRWRLRRELGLPCKDSFPP